MFVYISKWRIYCICDETLGIVCHRTDYIHSMNIFFFSQLFILLLHSFLFGRCRWCRWYTQECRFDCWHTAYIQYLVNIVARSLHLPDMVLKLTDFENGLVAIRMNERWCDDASQTNFIHFFDIIMLRRFTASATVVIYVCIQTGKFDAFVFPRNSKLQYKTVNIKHPFFMCLQRTIEFRLVVIKKNWWISAFSFDFQRSAHNFH